MEAITPANMQAYEKKSQSNYAGWWSDWIAACLVDMTMDFESPTCITARDARGVIYQWDHVRRKASASTSGRHTESDSLAAHNALLESIESHEKA